MPVLVLPQHSSVILITWKAGSTLGRHQNVVHVILNFMSVIMYGHWLTYEKYKGDLMTKVSNDFIIDVTALPATERNTSVVHIKLVRWSLVLYGWQVPSLSKKT